MRDEGAGGSVGGWLLLLCLYLGVWQPLTLANVAAGTLAALPVRGSSLAFLLAARVIVAAFGVAAAIALYHRDPAAGLMAKAALVLSASADLFVYTTSYFPSNRLPGDAIWQMCWSVGVHGAWLAYLFRSARVRRTLGSNTIEPSA